MSNNKRWEIGNVSESDILKKIEDLLTKATQTVHSVEYTRIMVTIMMFTMICLIIVKAVNYF